uniref:FKBP prolyl isomerase like n=1 Tax=Taeniopygia guttata TaxID=59729 RepID=A0A674HHN2_TAEGU
MEGAAAANEGAAPRRGANEDKEAEEAAANQQRDEGSAAANGNVPLKGSANERTRSCGLPNQDAETQEATNGGEDPQAANEDTGHKAAANENAAHTALANENSAPSPAANQQQAPPPQHQADDLAPLVAAANQAREPWDWSLEEAWLRTPEGEGLETWGVELEAFEAEPDEEEAELDTLEAELVRRGPVAQGAELITQGVAVKPQGAELIAQGEAFKPQGAGLITQGAAVKPQGAELKAQGEVYKPQGAELITQGMAVKPQGAELKPQGAELIAQGAAVKPQGAELDPCAVNPKDPGAGFEAQGAGFEAQGVEIGAHGAEPSPPDPVSGAWQRSPDGAWWKLRARRGQGLARPGPGSLCRVRLRVPVSCRSPWGAPAVPCGRWLSVRLGEAEGRWSALLDAALETMAAGELAWLRPHRGDDDDGSAAVLLVRLGRFAPAPPFWAAPPAARWHAVEAGLARGAALAANGRDFAAVRALARALRRAVAAAGPAPLPERAAALKAELHAALAAAQLRLGRPAAAASNAGRALALRPAHLEARYARGVALAAMRDLEAARQELLAVLRARPGHGGARRELGRVRGAARERDAQLGARLGKMFA